MPNYASLTATLVLIAGPLGAQQTTPRPVPAAAEQIAQAVLPLPDSMRSGARVFGWAPDGRFVVLRPGTGIMTCRANDPHSERFQVVCYHNSMEEFMARGRELRAEGVTAVDSVRNADVLAGRVHLPPVASLYSLNGGTYDPATNTIRGARPLYVVYLPFATEASTGISTVPLPGKPWLMHAGQPGAHIMYVPGMP